MKSVEEICELLRDQAATLAPELLPNGRRAGDKWMFSGVADTGQSESAWVHLSGPKIGRWFDMGNAAPGEDKGDMLDLLRLKGGFSQPSDALQEAKRLLGIEDAWKPDAPKRSPEEIERRAAEARARAAKREADAAQEKEAKARGARSLYLKGRPIASTPAEAYLVARGLDGGDHWPNVLRFHPDVWCGELRVKVPAMLAAIYDAAGVQIGTHRTFLQCTRGTWGKADVLKPKKVLGSFWGGFIPINKGSSGKSMRSIPEGEAVNALEGIEKGIAVRMMRPGFRIISTVSLANMGAIVLPPAAKILNLICDRDESETAQDQLMRAIAQQQARGLRVTMVMPPRPFKDIDEWMIAWRAEQRAQRYRDGGQAA